MIPRNYNSQLKNSLFILGPRGTGKTTWLKRHFDQALYIDLLKESTFQEYLANPSRLEAVVLAQRKANQPVIIDEVQRLPQLLNEVHRLIESHKVNFILTGSSARQLKRQNANLLAGRARTMFFHPLTAEELGSHFSIERSLKFGNLPAAYFSEDPKDYLKSYIGTYLREEVQQEALVRRLPVFHRFLEAASFSQGGVLSVQAVANDVGVDRKTAESYFQLLEDLLLGVRIEVFKRRAKRKVTQHPKFYFFDTGVFRTLRPQGPLDSDSEIDGAALETLVLQELRAAIDMHAIPLQIYFWRTSSKLEVDFVLYGEPGLFAFEVKRASRIRKEDLKSLLAFKEDYPMAKTYLLYTGEEALDLEGVKIRPVQSTLPVLAKLINPC